MICCYFVENTSHFHDPQAPLQKHSTHSGPYSARWFEVEVLRVVSACYVQGCMPTLVASAYSSLPLCREVASEAVQERLVDIVVVVEEALMTSWPSQYPGHVGASESCRARCLSYSAWIVNQLAQTARLQAAVAQILRPSPLFRLPQRLL